jgi:hypothetical protein
MALAAVARFRPVLLAAVVLAAVACGGDTKAPTTERLPDAASLIPAAPAPQPTPTPVPGSTPEPTPFPADPSPGRPGGESPTAATGCGDPFPPVLSRINVKVHGQQSDRTLLDATPLVADLAYCQAIGFPDRAICPVRPEGHPERVACETAVVGVARDTGRSGPTWSANGRACTGPDGGTPACQNHGDNQYLAFAYGSGVFRACAASGVCGEVALP